VRERRISAEQDAEGGKDESEQSKIQRARERQIRAKHEIQSEEKKEQD
jgi:hypothetical protein